MAGKELKGREKVVSKMTRDGLTEENLADGSVKDISHKSRGRPPEMTVTLLLAESICTIFKSSFVLPSPTSSPTSLTSVSMDLLSMNL